VRTSEYAECRYAYSMKVGFLTLTLFVTLVNEVYTRSMISDMEKIMMNNLVDIR
jgi:hypothetical protein